MSVVPQIAGLSHFATGSAQRRGKRAARRWQERSRRCGISLGENRQTKEKEQVLPPWALQGDSISQIPPQNARQEQLSEHRADLPFPPCWQGKPGCVFTEEGNTGEYSGTVFLLAYTRWVLLSRLTLICTWKKLDLVLLFSAKLQESV